MTDLAPTPQDVGLALDWIVAVPADGHVLYRITVDATPKVHDLLSKRDNHDQQMRGEHWLLYIGLSMFAEPAQADAIRDRFKPHQHVAEVESRSGRGLTLARTRKTAGHHTVWGRPEDLLAAAFDYRVQTENQAMTYAILYIENGDFIADFDSEDAARAALADFLLENPSVRERVGLLAFDDDGMPVGEALAANELLPA